MTEDEFRHGRAPGPRDGTGADLHERLTLAGRLLARTLADLRGGALPIPAGAQNMLDRDEALACAAKADGIAHFLRHPSRAAALLTERKAELEARVVAETDRIIDEARDREQGEEP